MQIALGLIKCALTRYKGANFQQEAVVDVEFVPAIKRIQQYAANRNVYLQINHSYRHWNWKPRGATVVPPSKTSNHYAGHAIDMNPIYNGISYSSTSMKRANFAQLPQAVQAFLNDIRNDHGLRWGGGLEQ